MSEVLIYDFETLGTRPTTVVLSFSAIATNWSEVREDNISGLKNQAFFCSFKKADQIERGRTIEQSTVDWWKKQSDEAKQALKMEPRYDLYRFIDEFAAYCSSNGVTKDTTVLIRGQDFDSPIMKNIHQTHGDAPLPYNNWAVRDVRSIVDIIYGTSNGYPPGSKARDESLGLVGHDPTHDCIKDLLTVRKCLDIVHGHQ